MKEETQNVLIAPYWLNTIIISMLVFDIVLMGYEMFLAIAAFQWGRFSLFAILQYIGLLSLGRWHDRVYIPVPKNRQICIFTPTNAALEVHTIKTPVVYLLQDVEVTGYVKIGRSKNPYHRLRDFGVQLPFKTHLVHVIRSQEDEMVEAFLHQYFGEKRIRGEWFEFAETDLRAIVELTSKIENGHSD